MRFYTIGSAWVSQDEAVSGSLEVGKQADRSAVERLLGSTCGSDRRHRVGADDGGREGSVRGGHVRCESDRKSLALGKIHTSRLRLDPERVSNRPAELLIRHVDVSLRDLEGCMTEKQLNRPQAETLALT